MSMSMYQSPTYELTMAYQSMVVSTIIICLTLLIILAATVTVSATGDMCNDNDMCTMDFNDSVNGCVHHSVSCSLLPHRCWSSTTPIGPRQRFSGSVVHNNPRDIIIVMDGIAMRRIAAIETIRMSSSMPSNVHAFDPQTFLSSLVLLHSFIHTITIHDTNMLYINIGWYPSIY
jgi:hypothetical protein